MKIAYLVDNPGDGCDLTNIMYGNPGVGGTLYHTILMVWYCMGFQKHQFYILHKGSMKLPDGMGNITITDFEDGVRWCKDNDIDYYVIVFFKDEKEKDKIEKYGVKVIAWPSIFLSPKQLELLADCELVRQVVWVGVTIHSRFDI